MNKTNFKLDKEEQKIEEDLNQGEYVNSSNIGKVKQLFQVAVINYQNLQSTKRISIRINLADLIKVKVKAKKYKIPYQTLLNALIHHYAENRTKIQV